MEKRVPIRAYNKVWKMDKRIYSIQNFPLPVPVSLREVGYFAAVAGIMFLLQLVLPPVQYIPSVLRFVVIPYSMTQFLLKKKLDGKPPIKYLVSWIKYISTKNEYMERFKLHPGKHTEKIKIDWFCSQGYSAKSHLQTVDTVPEAELLIEPELSPAPQLAEEQRENPEPEEMPAADLREAVEAPAEGRTKRSPLMLAKAAIMTAKKREKAPRPVKTRAPAREEKEKPNMEKLVSMALLGVVLVAFIGVMVLSALK